MKQLLRISLTTLATGTAVAALVVAAMPVWLLLRVPAALIPPEPETR